jgi:hypothetical protein
MHNQYHNFYGTLTLMVNNSSIYVMVIHYGKAFQWQDLRMRIFRCRIFCLLFSLEKIMYWNLFRGMDVIHNIVVDIKNHNFILNYVGFIFHYSGTYVTKNAILSYAKSAHCNAFEKKTLVCRISKSESNKPHRFISSHKKKFTHSNVRFFITCLLK